jgi:WD40 repeat protein
VWKIASNRPVEIARINHDDVVQQIAFSPREGYIATASVDATAHIWDLTVKRHIAGDVSHRPATLSPHGKYVAMVDDAADIVRVWDVVEGQQVTRIGMTYEGILAFSLDGKSLVTVAADAPMRVWDVVSGRQVTELPRPGDHVGAFAFSPEGQYLAIVNPTHRTAQVWRVSHGRQVASMQYDGTVKTVALSQGGKYLATLNQDKTAQVWDVTKNRHMTQKTALDAIAFSPDGQHLAALRDDRIIQVWEVATDREVARISSESQMKDITFSPNGKHLATTDGNTIQVWKMAAASFIFSVDGTIRGHLFSPDGQYLAAVNERSVRVWDLSSGQEVFRITHESAVQNVAFSPDGRYLTTLSVASMGDARSFSTVQAWLWRPQDLIADACSRLIRNLTPDEWRQHLGDEPYRKTCPNLP